MAWFAKGLGEDGIAGVAFGDASVIDEDADDAPVLIGKGFAIAVVDIGAAGHLGFEEQVRAFAHFGEDIAG